MKFVKVVGSGNDFILIDPGVHGAGVDPSRLARSWCDRARGIGADGLLVVLPSRRGDARMRIFNPDGSEAKMCGNGLRCVAWVLYARDHGRRARRIETASGLLNTRVVSKERVRIGIGVPKSVRLHLPLKAGGKRLTVHCVDTGVPHAVAIVRDVGRVDLDRLGRSIRFHRIFGSQGTNVDFIQVENRHRLRLRTFERGVEGETLACGTGAVASAVVATQLEMVSPPVTVRTAGGENLEVEWNAEDGWTLIGPARISFEGVVPW